MLALYVSAKCGHVTLYLSYHIDILKHCVSLCFSFQCCHDNVVKTLILLPQTQLQNVQISHHKYPKMTTKGPDILSKISGFVALRLLQDVPMSCQKYPFFCTLDDCKKSCCLV